MEGGLFIALYDEDTLKLYLNKGIYGFLMKPVNEEAPSSRSKHYAALADYACAREGQASCPRPGGSKVARIHTTIPQVSPGQWGPPSEGFRMAR